MVPGWPSDQGFAGPDTGRYPGVRPDGSEVRRRVRRMVLRLEAQLADDFPLLCGCDEVGAAGWSADCAT